MEKIIDITVFGCEPDEMEVFQKISYELGVTATLIKDSISESNAGLAAGCRCVSVSHKAELSEPILLALKNAGVKYISTRSIGFNHIDIQAAGLLGMVVGTVEYSPGSVADYTVMLMLMLMRGTKSILRETQRQNYCLNDLRGKELRDMTVGVLGTGRIGHSVMERLEGFGCKVLSYYRNQKAGADYVGAEELIPKIQNDNWFDYYVVVATPDMMGVVGRLGKVLGPKGLMPNPKSGTVTMDVTKAIADIKSGKVEYRLDKTNIIHLGFGKVSFGAQKLQENYQTIMDAIIKAKPAAAKGQYIKSISVTTTMGPGISVE